MQGAGSTALIAAGPGWLRDALRAMLASMSNVMILEADDEANAKALLHRYHPLLVIIDSDLPGNHGMQLIEAACAGWPRTRCAILVNDVYQQAAAMKAGADHAAFKGEPAPRLFTQIEQLLSLS